MEHPVSSNEFDGAILKVEYLGRNLAKDCICHVRSECTATRMYPSQNVGLPVIRKMYRYQSPSTGTSTVLPVPVGTGTPVAVVIFMEVAVHPAAERITEAVLLFAPQLGGKGNQFCYLPRSGTNKIEKQC